jgi:hypothetical protein
MKNFRLIFIEDWKNGYWIFAFVAFLFDIVIPEEMVGFKEKIVILSVALTLGFILKLIIQLLNYRELDFTCKGYNYGSGIYENDELLKVDKDSRLQIDLILMLFDKSTTISSPVALVKIIDIDNHFAYGIKLAPQNKNFTEIIGRRDINNFILRSKISSTALSQLTE